MAEENSDIKVSIVCLTYNHAEYISQTLDSFLMQKTNFKFEVIVHDDASTDGTADTIRIYKNKYPDIIKPILQKDNQYSISKNFVYDIVYPQAKGKYIALCEGDDYWIDPLKLQKQFDFMESHPECSICFTNAFTEDMNDDSKRKQFLGEELIENITSFNITLKNVNEIRFPPTASYFFKLDDVLNMPYEYSHLECPGGDFKLRLYMTSLSYAYFMNEITCVYRINVAGSATTLWKHYTRTQEYEKNIKYVKVIDYINEFTERKYESELLVLLKPYYYRLLLNCGGWKQVKETLQEPRIKRSYSELNVIQKVKIYLKAMLSEKAFSNIKKVLGKT